MAFHKTTFERHNWTFGEKITQSLDVIFEWDGSGDIEMAAWAALREQASELKTEGVMKDLGVGWSTFLSSNKFHEISLPYEDREIERPAEDKPVIACKFSPKDDLDHSYRAVGFYRLEEIIEQEPVNVWQEITKKLQDREDAKKNMTGVPRFRLIKCLPENATIISGSGVGGCIIPIKDAVIGDLVNWSDITIKQEQGRYADRVSPEEIKDDTYLDQDCKRRMAKKLGMIKETP
jgi:hypothetical protein